MSRRKKIRRQLERILYWERSIENFREFHKNAKYKTPILHIMSANLYIEKSELSRLCKMKDKKMFMNDAGRSLFKAKESKRMIDAPPKKYNKPFGEKEIEYARSKSIASIFEHHGVDVKRRMASCPFHQEKTASLHIYEKDNAFKCFGCGEYGDSIKLHMHFTKENFPQAIMRMQRMY